jgi:hypothetical protein
MAAAIAARQLRDEGSLLRQNLSPRGSSFFNK